ncbi:hypothetical protein [Micromonospora sp. HUAS LYJ1]|uniref:hypothetical protein n=1 Tax=Micromonospora sp. HUAS LYJ1 TaxID=3061626 RepID=UPI0026710B9B|nr:hypothetical protein [Micromonospora sp. HUAS LYJ1]WKU04362.1 hypothetical protein Q2K16_26695 [Micromonospora sp. HUAS LYJ1]
MDDLTIEQRASKLLEGGNDKEDVRFFLSRLLQIQEDQGRSASRALARGAGLGLVFVVLTYGKLLEVELLGVKVQDISPVRVAIPIAVMFTVLRAVTLLRISLFYRRVFGEVVARYLPGWQDSGLVPLLSPWNGPMSTHASAVRLDVGEHPGVNRLHRTMRSLDAWSGIVALTGFQVYAFVVLFHDPKIPAVAALVSLAVSLMLMAFVAVYLAFTRRGIPTSAASRILA